MSTTTESKKSGSELALSNISKNWGTIEAVKNVSTVIKPGEFFTLLGPSGSGKTTTLQMIAGFETPDQGDIVIDGQSVANVPPNKRDIGMIFQSYALFPHMTVKENVQFPLKMRGISQSESKQRVDEFLRMVQLEEYHRRKPAQLSGGQQQRVALARALVFEPPILLMDEPLGALDKKLREQMQVELKRIQEELAITVVYVTHDQQEALNMSDRIGVMNNGQMVQVGKPEELYEKPKTRFVADFLGESNFWKGTVVNSDESRNGLSTIKTSSGTQLRAPYDRIPQEQRDVEITLRPEKIRVLDENEKYINQVSGIVDELFYLGEAIRLSVVIDGGDTLLRVRYFNGSGTLRFERGDKVKLGWKAEDMWVLACDEDSLENN